MKPSPPSSDYPFKWLPDGTPKVDVPEADGDEQLPTRTPRIVKKARWLAALEWVLLVGVALAIALLLKTFLFQAFYIPSESMIPTLEKNDRVIVNKFAYRLRDPHRGDIVVFKTPPGVDDGVKDLVKRIIGLPGETVEGRADGYVYVNGKRLTEPYLPKGVRTDPGFPKIKVPTNSYWVMGDNRTNSKDSRFFPDHFIKRSDILGPVFVRIWPPSRIGLL